MHPLKKMLIERAKEFAALPLRKSFSNLRQLSEEQFWSFQSRQFALVYEDAVRHVPYYRDHPHEYPIDLDTSRHVLEVLAELPVLPKPVVKGDPSRFWREPKLFLSAEHTTGGTTGTPLRVRSSLRERGHTHAILEDRYLSLVGKRNPRILRLHGFLSRDSRASDIFVKIPFTNFAYLSIYDLSPSRRDEIRRVIENYRPEVLHGYASALHQLALIFKDAVPPQLDHVLTVVSTSETLFPNQAKDIEEVLNARVYNEYGSQEGQHLVLGCQAGGLHIHPARGVVELLRLDSDKPAAPGELGRVVVTGLTSLSRRSMPLIRYDLGDSAVSTGYSADCACGSLWPTIGTVYGRTEDLIRTRDGRRIGLLSHSTLKDLEGIRESQIIQTGYERLHYLIAPENPDTFRRDLVESHVRKEVARRVGPDVMVSFEYVSSVPRTRAGKVQAVVVRFDEH